MKNFKIPPTASTISGLILIGFAHLPFFNQQSVTVMALNALGIILLLIGTGGLTNKLFRRKNVSTNNTE